MIRTTAALLLAGCDGGMQGLTTPVDDTAPVLTVPADDIPEEGTPTVGSFLVGQFETLPAFQGLMDVSGTAMLVKHLDGQTQVSVALSGIVPSSTHSVHVHVWPCEYEGGGHYKIDPTVVDTDAANELWPDVDADVDGNGTYELWADHWTRGDALAVVVHDPVTAEKMACADLVPEVAVGAQGSGSFAPFAAYELIDEKISGSVDLSYSSTNTNLDVSLQGLDDLESYTAHVHAQPCEVTEGGGHYKLDPTNDATEAANELWPEIVPLNGVVSSNVSHPAHAVREDAQSVVLHRGTPKVACANLTRSSYVSARTTGTFNNLPDADAKGLTVGGTATLQRRLDGTTVAEVEVTGLPPSASHPIHVHDKPCKVADGGGHYIVDQALGEGEDNEIWPTVVADANGAGSRMVYVGALARADAQSMVVHDGADSARLACVDLY